LTGSWKTAQPIFTKFDGNGAQTWAIARDTIECPWAIAMGKKLLDFGGNPYYVVVTILLCGTRATPRGTGPHRSVAMSERVIHFTLVSQGSLNL